MCINQLRFSNVHYDIIQRFVHKMICIFDLQYFDYFTAKNLPVADFLFYAEFLHLFFIVSAWTHDIIKWNMNHRVLIQILYIFLFFCNILIMKQS